MSVDQILTELNGNEMGCSNTCLGYHNLINPRHQALRIRPWGTLQPRPPPISQSDTLRNLDNFSFRYGANVRVKDFMAFSNNYYADLVDAGSGLGLAEVLVDRYTGNTY